MLRFLTAGESHGPCLTVIVDGVPAGLELDIERLNRELGLRQRGYGRGSRQKIETDRAEITGGVRHGITTGAPLSISIVNRDFESWRHVMSVTPVDESSDVVKEELEKKAIGRVRPGHADLPGAIKYHQKDIRDVLERASARETASRVAAGAVCAQILSGCGVEMSSHVISVGPVSIQSQSTDERSLEEITAAALESEMFCSCPSTTAAMIEFVKDAWQKGDSVGGVVEVLADGLPVGLGSYTQWDRRLDGALAQAVMSIQAMKAVEIGDGVAAASRPGSQVHDALFPAELSGGTALPFMRKTNHAGGLEGGMTNGARLRLRAYMKPIPTLRLGLPSLSVPDLQACTAHYERSDVCAVPAASIVVKAMTAFVLCRALLEKFGHDSMDEIRAAVARHRDFCQNPFTGGAGAPCDPEMEYEQ